MGVPDEFCYKEILRSDFNTNQACDPPRRSHCDGGYVKEGKIWKIQFCVRPERNTYKTILPFAAHPFIYYIKKPVDITVLHSVATFTWHIRSSHNTPYLTVLFTGHNHGSWVDIILQPSSKKRKDVQSLVIDKPENTDVNDIFSLKIVSKQQPNLLWMSTDHLEQDISLEVKLQTYFDEDNEWLIQHMEWGGNITLSPLEPTFCLSIPGSPYGGSIRKSGLYLVSLKTLSSK